MLVYYALLALIAGINLIIHITSQHKHPNTNITIIFYLCFISNLGYWWLATSTSLEGILRANKICYLGACFMLPHLLFAILQLSNYTISIRTRVLLYAWSMLMYCCILTTGYLPIYYKNPSLEYSNGISYIGKEYGFVHTIFYAALFGYVLLVIAFLIHIQIKRRNIPLRYMILFSTMICSCIIAFVVGKLLPAWVEVMPLLYVICEFIFLPLTNRTALYDIENSISNSLMQQQTYGYLAFDLEQNFLGGNEVAIQFLPELECLKVDSNLCEYDLPFAQNLSSRFDELASKETTQTYQSGEHFFNCTAKYLYQGKNKCGYLLEITDVTDHEKYVRLLNTYNAELSQSVHDQTAHIRAMHDRLLFTMGNMVENRDNTTGGHIFRTSHVVKLLVQTIQKQNEFDLPVSFYQAVIKYSPLHDLGKIAIDDSILRKPASLTPEEFAIIKTHSENGARIVHEILSEIEGPRDVTIACNIARYHHERWDGSGYPKGLAGEEIPLEARIMAIADVYDALVSERPYKDCFSHAEAHQIIVNSMGSHFDPGLLPYFEQCSSELQTYYEQVKG